MFFSYILDRRDGSVDNYTSRNNHAGNNYNNFVDRMGNAGGTGGGASGAGGGGGHRGSGGGGYRGGGGYNDKRGNERRSADTRTNNKPDYDNYRDPATNNNGEKHGAGTGENRERTSIDRDSNSSTDAGNNRRRRKAKNFSHNTSKLRLWSSKYKNITHFFYLQIVSNSIDFLHALVFSMCY